jgi:hypothetical protein
MTQWSLFIDDERFPADDGRNWRIARNRDEALTLIAEHGMPVHIGFDHDLGEDIPTGFDIAQTLVDMDLDGQITIPQDMTFYVHSQNPVGRDNIQALLTNYIAFKYAT